MRTLHRCALACAALVLLTTVCQLVLETPYWPWNGARLMLPFALARGVNYYVLLSRGGPLYNTIYGPMVAIVYLPATLFRTPNGAVLAGAVITVALCFSAVAFLHFAPLKRERSMVDVLAFLTAGFLMCFLEPLRYSCFTIHADAPGLALGAVACGALYAGWVDKWRIALPASALCAVLSVFCKQMFLPVPIVLLVWVLAVRGRKAAGRYLLWLAAAGGLATAAMVSAWGVDPVYHSLIWMPAHQPWKASHVEGLIRSAQLFIRLSSPAPMLVLACAIYCLGSGPMGGGRWRTLLTNRCAPTLLVGIALLPFSILGYAKVGSDVNGFSYALFFLTCGVTIMLADLWHGGDTAPARRLALSVLVATALLAAGSAAPLAPDDIRGIRSNAMGLSHSDQEVAFAYLKRHPGEAYFPWLPLAHLEAEGQFRHFVWGLADRWLAGETVSQAEFRAYIPRNPRVIAFASASGPLSGPMAAGYDLMKYLPEYSRSINDPELPGWVLYAKRVQ